MVDLHVHSTFSDGTKTPEELVDLALSKGLSAIALTDHDSVAGLPGIMEYAKGKEIEIVPGIEFSTDYNGHDVHLVGLFVDFENPDFQDKLVDFLDSRDVRNEKMCKALTEHGVPVTYDEMKALYPDATITRAHFGRYLVDKGFCKSTDEAFAKYVGDHAPCYIPREKITPFQACELVAEFGGVPVLAHPILYHFSDHVLEELVAKLKESGLIAIEAMYSTYSPSEERQIRNLASKYDLLLSGGSDYHGDNKPKISLGTGMGKLNIPDDTLTDLKKCLEYYVFSDMDGTLFDKTCIISDALKESIERFEANGNHLIPTSGRPALGAKTALEENGISMDNRIIIGYNGSLIYDCKKNAPLLEYKITSDEIAAIQKEADKRGIYMHSYSENSIIVKELTKETEYYMGRVHIDYEVVPSLAEACPDGAYKLIAINLSDHERLVSFRDWINATFPNSIKSFFSSPLYLEIIAKEGGKGEAVSAFMKMNHIPKGRSFACGDEANDVSMLLAAGTGVAVANAIDEAKKAADIITENDASHDALKPLFDALCAK